MKSKQIKIAKRKTVFREQVKKAEPKDSFADDEGVTAAWLISNNPERGYSKNQSKKSVKFYQKIEK